MAAVMKRICLSRICSLAAVAGVFFLVPFSLRAGEAFSLRAGESRVIDFGPDAEGGYPRVAFAAAEGPARIRLSYSTHPDGLGPMGDFWHDTRADYMGRDLWLPILPASTDRFDVFTQAGAGTWRASLAQGLVRYVRVAVESGSATVSDVSLVNDGIHSTEPVTGSFACSDPAVTAVWQASVRTCLLAAIPGRTQPLAVRGTHTNAVLGASYPYLSDGAKRDRLVWSGDLWWAQRNMYAAFPTSSPYMPGSLRMLAENRTPEGYVQACPFPESHGPLAAGDWGPFASDEFAAWFIPVLRDHVLYTGDLDLARELRPAVRGLVDYLTKHTAADGVFEQRLETAKHSCGLAVGGTSHHHRAYMNVLLWLAYRDAASLAAWLGDKADCAAWTARADATARAIRTHFWNAAKGHFILSREEPRFGFEACALALAAKFATSAEAAAILPQLVRHGHGKFQALAVRGAFEYGEAEKAMALVAAHNWYKVVDPAWKGTRLTSECMNLLTKGWGDEAHPDTAIAGIFSNYILGVEPLSPGYRTFRVRPQPVRGVTWAKGSVPTPYGPIEVSWKMGPKGPEVQVKHPAGTVRVAEAGRPFAVFPSSCVTPDGMAVDARDRLVIAAANLADPKVPGALFRFDAPGAQPYKWCDVPVNPATGRVNPMGICFGPAGELYVVDNQPWTGEALTKNRGRLLRLAFQDDKLVSCDVIAEGLEHPNGVAYHKGKLYLTQSMLTPMGVKPGDFTSGLYRFDPSDRQVKVTNSKADKQLLFTVKTRNVHCPYGLDGLAFDAAGALYLGNFGDGEILKVTFDAAGNPGAPTVFARSPFDKTRDPAKPGFLAYAAACPLRTTDGMRFGPDGWLYVADFSNNAVAKVSPDGRTVAFVRRDPDGAHAWGGLNQPGEPVFWRGRLIVSNFDAVAGNPDKVNATREMPATLTEVRFH